MLPDFTFTLKGHGSSLFEDDLLMFVRSASSELVEKAGKTIERLMCVLTKSVNCDLANGQLKLTCNVCDSGKFLVNVFG